MPPVRRIELVNRVLIHPEHNPRKKSEQLLCQHHYIQAVNCKMVDRYYGLVKGKCTICK